MSVEQSQSNTLFFAGGGSGGHLYPGVAVAQALQVIRPDLRCVFLCTDRAIDQTILKDTGFEFIPQPILPPRRSVGGLIKFWRSWRATQDLVKKQMQIRKPKAVLGLGGYAAGVAVKLASKERVPSAVLNPDVIPGKANQYLFSMVQQICCQFQQTQEHISKSLASKLVVTGCPIRPDILDRPSRAQALAGLGLDPLLLTLVITGASQGALTVNEGVVESLKRIVQKRERLQGWQVLHLAGQDHADAVRKDYRELELDQVLSVRVVDFTPAMRDVWAVADLAIARSGASTCAELIACGVPSILMPYPFHSDMHQLANAKVLEEAGGAVIVDDKKDRKLNAENLLPILERLLYDGPARDKMKSSLTHLAPINAAHRVAQTLVNMVGDQGTV
jgi:UDP-N-acetylglucosamine--N-acetylmuramyl-(pentapeptide) pyrophosphoryl-undecaprenol N-acetylglucosamine transferase